MILIVYFGLVEALKVLGFTEVVEILREVLEVSGKILFGLVILVLGNFISTIAYNTFTANENNNQFVGSIIRTAIIAVFLAIGLSSMGIASDIVNLAFGLTLGAIAVAIALSFGLGGREAAGRQMEIILDNLNGKAPKKKEKIKAKIKESKQEKQEKVEDGEEN